ncbi:MAG: outer membrane beta-barrel protein [Pseudomonadota bacterium]
MRTLKYLIAASAALMSTASLAADLPLAPPPYIPPPIEDFGGWYLRGDIGISNQQVKRLDNALDATLITQNQRLGFDSGGIYGLGAGYQFNNFFRADFTAEYRAGASFNGLDLNTFTGGTGVNNYRGIKSEWLFLANAYVDLGTWWCLTPFVGAGIGTSRVTISNFTDQGLVVTGGPPIASSAYADTASKWNFAWAVHAGVAYKYSPNVTMEFAYRYADLGDGITGDIRAFDGTNAINNPMTFKNITSHDLKLGVRWAIEPTPTYLPPPPLMRKG